MVLFDVFRARNGNRNMERTYPNVQKRVRIRAGIPFERVSEGAQENGCEHVAVGEEYELVESSVEGDLREDVRTAVAQLDK